MQKYAQQIIEIRCVLIFLFEATPGEGRGRAAPVFACIELLCGCSGEPSKYCPHIHTLQYPVATLISFFALGRNQLLLQQQILIHKSCIGEKPIFSGQN